MGQDILVGPAGQVQFRVEKQGIIHAGVGKASFTEGQLAENIRAFSAMVSRSKPSGAKGSYMKRAALSSTMGPGVKVDVASLAAVAAAAE